MPAVREYTYKQISTYKKVPYWNGFADDVLNVHETGSLTFYSAKPKGIAK